jgi:AraC-like DNA-binding protein
LALIVRSLKSCNAWLNDFCSAARCRLPPKICYLSPTAIATLLPHGQARHDVVAAKLAMSPLTLARRLASEGSSFVAILRRTRAALADRYLGDGALAIAQIARLLGYA